MKEYGWILVPVFLCFGILACTNADPEDGAKLTGTIHVVPSTPISQVEAAAAIKTYAQETLGIELQNLKAVGRSGEVKLPVTTQEGVDVALGLAGTTYFGLWPDGFASLSVGDSTVDGDWSADVEDGSLGTFWIRVDQDQPHDAAGALLLIHSAYPELASVNFIEISHDDETIKGFEFFTKQTDDIHICDWCVILTGTTIRAGVSPGLQQGKSIVWAVVASGALAAPFE